MSLVVTWFGDDQRAGRCRIRSGVEAAAKTTAPLVWSVNGVARADAQLTVLDVDRAAPPAATADGDRHIVASGATGAWSGWDG